MIQQPTVLASSRREVDPARTARLEAIRAALQAGTYDVDVMTLAERLIARGVVGKPKRH